MVYTAVHTLPRPQDMSCAMSCMCANVCSRQHGQNPKGSQAFIQYGIMSQGRKLRKRTSQNVDGNPCLNPYSLVPTCEAGTITSSPTLRPSFSVGHVSQMWRRTGHVRTGEILKAEEQACLTGFKQRERFSRLNRNI
jgi:hypothetical protein